MKVSLRHLDTILCVLKHEQLILGTIFTFKNFYKNQKKKAPKKNFYQSHCTNVCPQPPPAPL